MRRLNLFHLPASMIPAVVLSLALCQCRKQPADDIPAPRSLGKGTLLREPAVQTSPEVVSIISIDNSYDLALSASSDARPKSLEGYKAKPYPPFVERLYVKDLGKHEFRWKNIPAKNLMICIFKQSLDVDAKNRKIANKQDLVWMWTPEISPLTGNKITFGQGRIATWDPKANKYILSLADNPKNSLPAGIYALYILGWDNLGINITYSSRELPIQLSDTP